MPRGAAAVAVVPPAVAVVGQRVCATAPVAGADYSLQTSNGAAGERTQLGLEQYFYHVSITMS